jgi:hypothetical protein
MTATPPSPLSPLSHLPQPADPSAPTPPQPSRGGGLAIASLVVGIGAFVLGVVPFVGLAIGVAGVVLGIMAILKPVRLGFSVTGLALSAVACVTGVGVLSWMLLSAAPAASEMGKRALTYLQNLPAVSGQHMTTPCYSFEGPRNFINNQSATADADCYTNLQLWGEVDAEGIIKNTGVGTVLGEVRVEPIQESMRTRLSAEIDVDTVVETLKDGWLSKLGQITSLKEPTSLDGEPANITRAKSAVAVTKTKAVVAGFAPKTYGSSRGEVRLFVVTVVTPYDNGDQLIKSVVASWKWK